MEGHESTILSIDFSPLNDFLVSTSMDKSARIWNMKEHEYKAIKKLLFSERAGTPDMLFRAAFFSK